MPPLGIHVEAVGRDRHGLRLAVGTCGEPREVRQQVFAHLLLVLRDRLDVDQCARHFKWMHFAVTSSTGFNLCAFFRCCLNQNRTG